VADTVRALVGIMAADAAVGQVFNIGSSDEITILDLAHRIREMTGSSSEIVFVPYAVAYEENFEDMQRRVPSIDKIHQEIGWMPQIGLEPLLASIIESHLELRACAGAPVADATIRPVLVHTGRPWNGGRAGAHAPLAPTALSPEPPL
jgi:UDP-glucose 4-epimerase